MINRFYLMVAIGCFIAVLITLLLGRVFRKSAFVKYIPAVISAVGAVGLFIKARAFSEGFGAIGYVVLALFACAVSFVAFVTAFIMGLVQRK